MKSFPHYKAHLKVARSNWRVQGKARKEPVEGPEGLGRTKGNLPLAVLGSIGHLLNLQVQWQEFKATFSGTTTQLSITTSYPARAHCNIWAILEHSIT